MSFIGKLIETTSDDFGDLIRRNCLFVDKTRMIKEFMEGKRVSLIVRPRRFGKTINLSMLQHFFSSEVAGVQTKELFEHLAIAKVDNGEFIKKYQGQYPVIFITFKDTRESSLETTINQLRHLIKKLYQEHKKILSSDKLDDNDKTVFQHYLEGLVDNETLQAGLEYLSKILFKAHGKKAIILIDEYDSPLTHAYQHDFLDPLSDFMRGILSSALKTNAYLEKGLMTGILRVSKNNMLSGLNNLKIYTLFNKEYQEYFGFTENEVAELTKALKVTNHLNEIKQYYNGYNIGSRVIYNPWSLMNYLDEKILSPYWVLTSNDRLLKDSFLLASEETKAQLGDLMQGKSIDGKINLNLCYEDLMKDPHALWTLLLFCGYLTVESKKQEFSTRLTCQLKIPNTEILAQYREIFSDWFEEKLGKNNYQSFLSSLVTGDVEKFTHALGHYLMASLSVRDVHGKNAEKFYHGFVAGLIASIQDTHWVKSNGESGRGLYDLMLIPKNTRHNRGIIIEFKQTRNKDALKNNAEKALMQINKQAYDTLLKNGEYTHINQVLKVGLAFCDKAVLSAHQTEILLTHQRSELALTKTYLNKSLMDENEDLT